MDLLLIVATLAATTLGCVLWMERALNWTRREQALAERAAAVATRSRHHG